MPCITRIKGYGITSCPNGTSSGNYHDLTYPGKWTLQVIPNCNGVLAPFSPGGVQHSQDKYSSVVSITYEGCDLNPDQPCDCVNGGCVPKTTYNTPGVFPTLAACESGCAKNSNCTGECVDPTEIAAHQQAINTLKAKIC